MATDSATESEEPRSPKKALVVACAQQIIILGVTSFELDGGIDFLKCLYALVAYWVGFAILMIRRRTELTKFDIHFVAYGYLALSVLSMVAAPLVWHLRGVNVG